MDKNEESKESKLKKYRQICPFCFKSFLSLYGHQCLDLPPNFQFSKKIDDASFFKHIYKESDALSDQGTFDIYKLHPVKYQIAFLRAYQKEIDASIETSFKITDPIIKNPAKTETSSVTRNSSVPPSIFIKQICPYCYEGVPSLSEHVCASLPEELSPDFHFQEKICTNDFFIFLYKKLDAWSSSKNVDLYKLNTAAYRLLFFTYYDRMMEMEGPSLEKARMEKNYSTPSHKKSRFEKFEKEILEKAKKDTLKNFVSSKVLCPYCLQVIHSLRDHKCEKMPSEFSFESALNEELFFEDLYRKLRITTPNGTPDLIKINQSTYSTEFFQFYNFKLQKLHDSLYGLDEEDLDLTMDLSQLDNQDLSNMDVLDMMSRDYDLTGLPAKTAKALSTQEKIGLKTPPDDGMPWCFSCTHMMDCPKGVDSSQMETIFDCDLYENMNFSTTSYKSSIVPSDISICGICTHIDNCPLNLNSEQMEQVFQCHAFKETETNREDRENAIQKEIEEELEKEIQKKLEKKRHRFRLFKRQKKRTEEIIPNKAEEDLQNLADLENIDISIHEEAQIKITNEEKQDLLKEIMNRWEQDRGQLKVICSSCEAEMSKIVTTRKIFHRCTNYPECKIKADPWYISQAVLKGIVSHIEHGDLIILYQYDDLKNIVTVSEIYSDGKLFL
ncbi:hypothetical protein NEF87_000691 [Candidatus Lokiarchaeum ossiferum]|uniref:DNA topoisomerase type IA zn finger domain-containing protein n=1 Tax=Candidatus Lokiarchaeum ossiferum TaxID=2951803 RepID=A0ABY6HLX2_9ARCH|nr:hypothetical protein NEF87_000691 [Candidatus Lokiarchaeum sp. B-35]